MKDATRSATVFEFGLLFDSGGTVPSGGVAVPPAVFEWLELRSISLSGEEKTPWIRPRLIRGRRAVQVVNYVGIIRACDDFHIEVLPKVGRSEIDGDGYARKLLLKMLVCLRDFRHIQSASADLAAERMPLLEIFIAQFLETVRHVVQRGIRSKYQLTRDNLPVLRGKLLMSSHIKQNLTRPDRFFTEHDDFNSNRAENRILRAALQAVLQTTRSADNERLARELNFVFLDVPPSLDNDRDFAKVARERGMGHYEAALSWARLILSDLTPASGKGDYRAPSLLYPMETIFEAFVAKHLGRQTRSGFNLRPHGIMKHLVHHRKKNLFRLKPDLSVNTGGESLMVLDTKWKLLDGSASDGTMSYNLSKDDLYQLYAYGPNFLPDGGSVVLIYPRTTAFAVPLEVFTFPSRKNLKLWVVPFCLDTKRILLPTETELTIDLHDMFGSG